MLYQYLSYRRFHSLATVATVIHDHPRIMRLGNAQGIVLFVVVVAVVVVNVEPYDCMQAYTTHAPSFTKGIHVPPSSAEFF